MSDSSEISLHPLLSVTAVQAERSVRVRATVEDEVVALFQEYRGRLLRYLYCLGLPVQDAEEVAQEVFLALFRHLKDQKGRQNLRGWVFRVAHNLGLDRRTDEQRHRDLRGRALSKLSQEADETPSPEAQAVFKQRQQKLLAMLNALPAQQQCCLYLRAEGLNYREIAEVLGVSLGTVSQSLAKAVGRLTHADLR